MEIESGICLKVTLAAGAPVELVITPQTMARETGRPVGDLMLVESVGGLRRLLVSLGPRQELNAEAFRRAGGMAAKWLVQHHVASAGIFSR